MVDLAFTEVKTTTEQHESHRSSNWSIAGTALAMLVAGHPVFASGFYLYTKSVPGARFLRKKNLWQPDQCPTPGWMGLYADRAYF